MTAALLVLAVGAGCAFKRYAPPVSPPGADVQIAFSRAVERALADFDPGRLRGAFVWVNFNRTPGGRYAVGMTMAEQTSPSKALSAVTGAVPVRVAFPQEEDFVAEQIRRRLAASGTFLVPERRFADVLVFPLITSSGAQTTVRLLEYQYVTLFYSEELQRSVDLLVAAYDRRTGVFFDLLTGRGLVWEMQAYLMRVCGPTMEK